MSSYLLRAKSYSSPLVTKEAFLHLLCSEEGRAGSEGHATTTAFSRETLTL